MLSQRLVKCFWPCEKQGEDEKGGGIKGELGELMHLLSNTNEIFSRGRP